ncbi:MAG: hypothetical protein JXB47_08145 [Anaerolineae bacterium]|nr:hypothetical protein [Anaerolineae bacterium]
MSSAKIIGLVLLIIGLFVFVGAGAWGLAQMSGESPALDSAAFILLMVIAGFFALLFAGVGLVMLRQGTKETIDQAEAARQRKILDMIATRGEIKISEVAIELQTRTEDIRAILERLVGLGIFSGYINWDKDMLYSADAGQLRDAKQCLNCGGDVKLAGKGVIQCPWCGAEYFLS